MIPPSSHWKVKRRISPVLIGIGTFVGMTAAVVEYNWSSIKEGFAQIFPQKDIEVNIETILQEKQFVPEEFYIKLFGNDDFLPVSSTPISEPSIASRELKPFFHLDGQWHEAQFYTFALEGVKSGHRPHNRKEEVPANHDKNVSWLDAISDLTNLDITKAQDQRVAQTWIAANYTRMLQDGRTIDPDHISFKEENGKIIDITYDGSNADAMFSVSQYTAGSYSDADRAYIPSGKTTVKPRVTNKGGHLNLPAVADEAMMLLVPDYILRDNIHSVNAGVRIALKQSMVYKMSVEEISAELKAVDENQTSGMQDPYAQMIITPTLELIVSDIIDGKKGQAKFDALVRTIGAENYSDSKFNSPPLVTSVAGGQCGGTASQFATMLYLAGIKDFHAVYFAVGSATINHVGLYGPLRPGLPALPIAGEYDQYWYVETTNGKTGVIGEFMASYGITSFDPTFHAPVDLRPQLQFVKAAKEVKEKR